MAWVYTCPLYTSDAADATPGADGGARRRMKTGSCVQTVVQFSPV
ncbi:hypothetical protein JMUB7554_27660 [Staphylococcus aureus]